MHWRRPLDSFFCFSFVFGPRQFSQTKYTNTKGIAKYNGHFVYGCDYCHSVGGRSGSHIPPHISWQRLHSHIIAQQAVTEAGVEKSKSNEDKESGWHSILRIHNRQYIAVIVLVIRGRVG